MKIPLENILRPETLFGSPQDFCLSDLYNNKKRSIKEEQIEEIQLINIY